jgi:L-amino acid N-acyltransferase YncA
MGYFISQMNPGDWDSVRSIYQQGMASGYTFETSLPDWNDWEACHLPECRLVARENDRVVGWAALSSVSKRAVYRGVTEVSIYVSASDRRKGIGNALLDALIDASEMAGYWTLQGVILIENTPSIALFECCGFRQVGYREKIGQRDGIWKDTVLMERRSKVVGIS